MLLWGFKGILEALFVSGAGAISSLWWYGVRNRSVLPFFLFRCTCRFEFNEWMGSCAAVVFFVFLLSLVYPCFRHEFTSDSSNSVYSGCSRISSSN